MIKEELVLVNLLMIYLVYPMLTMALQPVNLSSEGYLVAELKFLRTVWLVGMLLVSEQIIRLRSI